MLSSQNLSLPSNAAHHLRSAIHADQPTINALIRASHINPIGLKWPQFVLAVTADNTLIGCGQVKPHRDGSRELASIAVIPEWRNQGIAAAIIKHLLDIHAPPLWLTCESRLNPFYQKFGFTEIQTAAHMPLYFRRIFRFSQWLVWLLRNDKYLAVMFWEG
jgi:N-acetylglutamate synthase-like GNAT family acetyltransferase